MMQPDTLNWLLPNDGHPSLEQLRLYQQDEELSPRTRHQVEKHLLDCEMCSDVLAGMFLSNRAQTQAAFNQVNQQLKNRIQAEPQRKIRPMYTPMLRLAAAVIILVISAGLFRYFQQSNQITAPEKSTIAQGNPEPATTIPAPAEDPVIKPAEPEPQVEITPKIIAKATAKTPPVARTKVKKERKAVAPPAEELTIPIDSAVVLDAFAVKASDTPRTGFVNSGTPDTGGKVNLQETLNKVASSLTGKQMGISLQRAGTFAGQTVSGRVSDASGEPIAGATVIVKGSTTGTTTDAAGNFSLNVPPGKDALTFNYIGYESQEKKINAGSPLAVKLKEDQNSLQEVAVVGYGEAKDITLDVTRAKPQTGYKAFNQYIRDNLRYPAEARQQKQEGRVEIGFTVTEQGQLTNFKILKSLSPACDAEAMRIVKEGPAWQPARLQNQTQPEEVRVTVKFKLQ